MHVLDARTGPVPRLSPPAPGVPHPVDLAVLGLPPIVAGGLGRLLRSAPARVRPVAGPDVHRAEVALFDPDHVGDRDLDVLPPTCARVVLVAAPTAALARRARSQGAVRMVRLDVEPAELLVVLEEAGGRRPSQRCRPLSPDLDDDLSAREREVLAGVCLGMSNDEIAADLFLTINTVKTYIRSAYRKIDVTTRAQATLWGLRHGY